MDTVQHRIFNHFLDCKYTKKINMQKKNKNNCKKKRKIFVGNKIVTIFALSN